MVRVSHLVAVVVLGTAFAASSCKNAELGDPTPTGITVSVDASSITADDGSVTVRAQVFEDGIALLEEGVTFSIDGALAQTPVIALTDPTTGIAEHTFANLRTVGSGNVIVSAGDVTTAVTASAPLTVTPGLPATLTVDAGGSANADQGSSAIEIAAIDAYSNPVPTAPINLSTDAPGAIIANGTLQNLRVAGNWSLLASIVGYPAVSGTDGYIVTAGTAQQAKASLGQSTVGKLQTLEIYCEEQDQYGNATGAPFAATTQVFTTPSSTITSLGGGHFTASGFTVTGPATAHCDKGSIEDVKTFQVVAQTADNTVVANLDRSVVEGGMTATLTCTELDPFGNDTGAAFTDVTTTATGAVITGSGNTFMLQNLKAKGTFSATCNLGGASNSDAFAVVDTTPPVITEFAITAPGTPHNGGLDGRHGRNETVTITMTAFDVMGLSRQEVGFVSGTGSQTAPNPALVSGTGATSAFSYAVNPDASTFAQIVLRGQAADATGNTTNFPADITITVDPGAGIAVSDLAVSIRTHWEHPTLGIFPVALVSSGSTVYVKNLTGLAAADEIRRIPSEGTVSTVVASDFIPGQDDNSDLGFVHVPGTFGGRTLFHSLVGGTSGQIGAFAGSMPLTHSLDPIKPRDMDYGTVGADTGLYYFDDGGVFPTILRSDAGGAVTPFFVATNGQLANASGLAVLGDGIFVGNGTNILRVAGSPPAAATFAPGEGFDLCVGTGSKLLSVDGAGNLSRITTLAPIVNTSLTAGLDAALGCAVTPSGEALVLDAGDLVTRPARVYKVTGY